MRNWFWSLLWRAHHWDVALSYRIALPQAETQPRSPLYWPALVGAHLGDSWLWALVAGFFFRHAHTQRNVDGGRRTRLVAGWVATIILSTVVTLLLKRGVRRTRPGSARLLYGWGVDVHSFPSGHAARLSTIAVWSCLLLPAGGNLAWLLALIVGWSRVALGIHYVGDVVAGYAVGSLIGIMSRRLQR
ncbi:MAG: phosphatase PAP2 family protein [Chloroflexota bacterium]|nr:phosphatase PAP2 family protein [Chloroflexota bacterium]